ncbi:MAG: pilus assembly protein TadG-related protein, partial [Thermoguttaceae bacterium]|nr:pilus assembly protein TadG-related protein [Thermoguttaceae bacterium]
MRNRSGRDRRARRGIATFWLLLFVPVFLVLLGLVVNVANLWLARVELETALEAAALAAVKEWGENLSGGTSIPTQVGQA